MNMDLIQVEALKEGNEIYHFFCFFFFFLLNFFASNVCWRKDEFQRLYSFAA